jgi:uncharacterized membrane protein YfcA
LNWIFFAIAGSVAQLIDGALGMGFGLTSSTLLLTLGASAAVASAAVHAAEIGTTLVSGASHWRAENIDKDVLVRLAIPGGIGALLGATFLSSIDLSASKIFISTLLLFLGFLLLYRNLFQTPNPQIAETKSNPRFLTFLGFTGGFVDAAGGGGWGPVVTPTLMTATNMTPRKIIGTVSAAEFIVAVSASVGFLLNINKLDINWAIVGGLALGGSLMAPIAARIVSKLPRRQLAVLVGVAVIVINGYRIISG